MTALVTLIACALLAGAALLGFFWIRRSRPATTAGSVRSHAADTSSNADGH